MYLNHRTAVSHMRRLMTKPTKWLSAQRRLRSAWDALDDLSECSLGAHAILLVLSWGGSYVKYNLSNYNNAQDYWSFILIKPVSTAWYISMLWDRSKVSMYTSGKRSTCTPPAYYRRTSWPVPVDYLTCVNKSKIRTGIGGHFVQCEFIFLFYFFAENRRMSYAVVINICNTDTRIARKSQGFLQILFLP